MQQFIAKLVITALGFCSINAIANQFDLQDLKLIEKFAEEYLQKQSNQYQGKTIVIVGKVDTRLQLQKCDKLQAFIPNGSKVWGKTTIGIRCNNSKPWVIFLSAEVKVFGDYYQSRIGLTQGQNINEQDLIKMTGEISSMPASTVSNINSVAGKILLTSIVAGSTLRQEMLKELPVVQQGQLVKVTVYGNGFNVSNEAIAINNASEGKIAKAKTSDGQLISGIARVGGIIEISN